MEGWADAAGVATAAAGHIARDAETLAVFDTDTLIDFRARRPGLDIADGSLNDMVWNEITVARVQAGARDVLILIGPEPDFRWRAFASDVLDLALRAGITQLVSLGAIPFAIPHTIPTPVMMTATPRELLPDDEPRPEGTLRVPAAALNAVELAVTEHGIPAVGFWAQTPHYLTSFTQGALALVQRLGRHLGVMFETSSLVEGAARELRRLSSIVDERPEVRDYVAGLEEVSPAAEEIPSGDEIAGEIERYLRGRGPAE